MIGRLRAHHAEPILPPFLGYLANHFIKVLLDEIGEVLFLVVGIFYLHVDFLVVDDFVEGSDFLLLVEAALLIEIEPVGEVGEQDVVGVL